MDRLNKMCIEFNKQEARTEKNSIYDLDLQNKRNPYDTDKVLRGFNKITKGTEKSCNVDLKK